MNFSCSGKKKLNQALVPPLQLYQPVLCSFESEFLFITFDGKIHGKIHAFSSDPNCSSPSPPPLQ